MANDNRGGGNGGGGWGGGAKNVTSQPDIFFTNVLFLLFLNHRLFFSYMFVY